MTRYLAVGWRRGGCGKGDRIIARMRTVRCLRWASLVAACLVAAYALVILSAPWFHPAAPALTSSFAEAAAAELTVPLAGSIVTPHASGPLAVPPDAVLTEGQAINGYEIALWEPPSGQWWVHGHAIAQIQTPGGQSDILDFVSRIHPVSGTDITGDGIPELVLELYSGGASCCVSYVVKSLGAEAVNIPLPLSSPAGASFEDLDGDGVLEIVGADDSFRCVLCCCADSPEPIVVLKYRSGQGYVAATPDFPQVYDALLPEYRARAESRPDVPSEDEGATRRCSILPLVLAYLYAGRANEAWETLAQYSPTTADAEALRAELERVASRSSLFVASESWSRLLATREWTFSVQIDLNGDGRQESIVGVQAEDAGELPEYAAPGDVYVFADAREETGTSQALPPVFSCRSSLPADFLPYFYQASLAGVGDLDGDGLGEAVFVWLGQQWWPSAYRPLAVLDFNPTTRLYSMTIDIHRSVSEIGDYAVEDVDDDGRAEILEIDPVYGTEADPTYGTEVGECHFCPHQYTVEAFEFTRECFVADSQVNSGEPLVTSQKYEPYVENTPVGSFLAELVALARNLVQSSPATFSGLPDQP